MRWTAGPAFALAALAAVLAVVASGKDDPKVTAGSTSPARYAPTGLDGRYRLNSVFTEPPGTFPEGETRHTYGRRAADGVSLEASLQVDVEAAGSTSPPASPDDELVTVRGREAVLIDSGSGASVHWREEDGRQLRVAAWNTSRADVLAVANGLTVEPDDARATALPPGFEALPATPGELAERATTQHRASLVGGPTFSLTVYEEQALSLDSVLGRSPLAKRADVNGKPALLGGGLVAWMPRPGVLLVLQGDPSPGAFTDATMLDVAARVRSLDEGSWQRLVGPFATAPGAAGGRGPSTSVTVAPDSGKGRSRSVAVASGPGWKASAYRDGDEVCLVLTGTGVEEPQCATIGGSATWDVRRDAAGFLTFIVGPDVEEIIVESTNGFQPFPVQGSKAGLPARFVVMNIPTGVEVIGVEVLGTGGVMRRLDQLPPVATTTTTG